MLSKSPPLATRSPFVTSIVVALALTGMLAAPAFAQNPFIIDGNVPFNGNPGGVPPTQVTDPSGNAQELGPENGSDTKVGVIHLAVPPMLDTTNPNGQVDLNTIWTQTALATNGNLWFYFAWARDSKTGSGVIAFEFQQAALSPTCVYTNPVNTLIANCNPWVNRQAGDFLILWDQQGSGLTLTRRVFQNSPTGLVLGPNQALGSAVVAISTVGDTAGFRGEAAINLTTDVFPTSGDCVNFANILPGTITGNSDTADYKDTVLAAFPPISNCGSLRVIKVTNPATLTGTFPYTVARTSGNVRFDGTQSIPDTLTGAANEFDLHTNLIVGTNYTLTETVPDGWMLTSIICGGTDVTANGTFAVAASTTTECTITNRRKRGSIRVIKVVMNNNGGTAAPSAFMISLGDTAKTTFPGGDNIFSFDEGYSFNVTEIGLPIGYVELSKSGTCVGTIADGITHTCTITNDDQPGTLIVNKLVVNDNGGTKIATDFSFQVNGGSATAFLQDTDPLHGKNTLTVSAGTYNVTEPAVSGYTTTYSTCSSVVVANGGTETCTITNDDQAGTLIVKKLVVNDNGGTKIATDFSFQLNGGSATAFLQDTGPLYGKNTLTVSAGTYNVTEPAVSGYTTTSSTCSSVVVANGGTQTCTITNDDQKAAPGGATVQRTILHDTLTITGIRTGAPDAADARVRFRLYSDAGCSTPVGEVEEVTIALKNSTGTATTAIGVLVSAPGTYFWTTEYTGDQYNTGGLLSVCGDERTTVTFVQK